MPDTVLDNPPAISMWYVLSAVSQLTFELKTGRNYYGKTSVYTGIRRNMIADLPARATVPNKLIALNCILTNCPDETGEVWDEARTVLAAKLEELGLEFTA